MRTSINHTSMVAALELCPDGRIENKHGKVLADLAEKLIEVPGQTLGIHTPDLPRLMPAISAMERAGLIMVERKGTRIFSIALTGKHKEHKVLEDEAPELHAAQIIEALALVGGRLEDLKGHASTALISYLKVTYPEDQSSKKAWQHRINMAVDQGWIERDVRHSRTFSIGLTELGLRAAGLLLNGHVLEEVVIEHPADLLEPEPEPEPESRPIVEAPVLIAEAPNITAEAEPEPPSEFNVFDVLTEDDEVFWAIEKLLTLIRHGKNSAVIMAENARLENENQELQELLRMADADIKKLRAELIESQRISDKLGKDRDDYRHRYARAAEYLTAAGLDPRKV